LLLLATGAFAQGDRGTITGAVGDPACAVVPGAVVAARNTETGVVSQTKTTDTGNYTLGGLPAGHYDLSVEMQGFKKSVTPSVQVQVAQVVRVDVTLQVGVATESVTVAAEAPQLRTENAEQSMNVRGDKVNELPLNFGGGGGQGGGIRNWLSFMFLEPGISGTNFNSPGSNVINGNPACSFGNFKV